MFSRSYIRSPMLNASSEITLTGNMELLRRIDRDCCANCEGEVCRDEEGIASVGRGYQSTTSDIIMLGIRE